jgi:hypothetical protein
MKKIIHILFYCLLAVAGLLRAAHSVAQEGNAQGGNVLSGKVTDSASGKPLAGVSVFLNSTSKGTITRADGSFLLPGIPGGRYELIVSAIGYETFVTGISSRSLPPPLKIALHTKASELAAFTVEPYLKDGWKKWGKFFLDNFIGTTDNASSTSIKNREVLRFHFYKKSNRMSVTAIEPLIIENKALGYNLEYRLEGFTCDFSTNIISYFGYPLFREMTSEDPARMQKWAQHRRAAYTGSLMHFMRSLYNDQIRTDGFIVEHEINVPNLEKRRVKEIYNPALPKTDSFSIDTLHHFWEVLRQPDLFTRIVRGPEGLLTIHPDQTKVMFFTGKCTVIYGNGKMGIAYQESAIRLITEEAIIIEENGSYYPAQEVLTLGNWSKTETMANLLPRDFGMYDPKVLAH